MVSTFNHCQSTAYNTPRTSSFIYSSATGTTWIIVADRVEIQKVLRKMNINLCHLRWENRIQFAQSANTYALSTTRTSKTASRRTLQKQALRLSRQFHLATSCARKQRLRTSYPYVVQHQLFDRATASPAMTCNIVQPFYFAKATSRPLLSSFQCAGHTTLPLLQSWTCQWPIASRALTEWLHIRPYKPYR